MKPARVSLVFFPFVSRFMGGSRQRRDTVWRYLAGALLCLMLTTCGSTDDKIIPGDFTLTGTLSGTSVTLEWTAAENADNYQVNRQKTGASEIVDTGQASPKVYENLSPGTWTFFVRAWSTDATYKQSNSVEFTVSDSAAYKQQAYVKAANVQASYVYGIAVAVDSDTMVVGSPNEASNATTITNGTTADSDTSTLNAGAVYVYVRSGGSWTQQAYIKAPNNHSSNTFGTSVAISGDTIVVGAPSENAAVTTITNGTTASGDQSASGSGAAYVFKRTGTSWAQEAYIKPVNNLAGNAFGSSVAISSDTIAVGALGEASNSQLIINGATASSNTSASSAGAVYVYKRTSSSWAQEAYIKPSNTVASMSFGTSLALDTNTLVVGATGESGNQSTISHGSTASTDQSVGSSGAVYVFKRTSTSWAQEAYLKAPNNAAGILFGHSVAISGDSVVVGAKNESSNQTTITNGTTASSDTSASSAGAAYVFTRSGATWTAQAYLKPSNNLSSYNFGISVAISGSKIAVGAAGESSNQTTITNGSTASSNTDNPNAGAVYVFSLSGSEWSQAAYLKAPNVRSNYRYGISTSMSGSTIAVGSSGEKSNQTTITNGETASSDNSLNNAGAAYVIVRE